MAHDHRAFFTLAQLAVGTTQEGLGKMLGIARRTAQRYAASGVAPFFMPDLARIVYPHDRALAVEIASAAGQSLESLGLERPAGPPPPPPDPPVAFVDAIVCAAADVRGAVPAEVRPVLLAAFTRARELGVEPAFVERVLRAQLAPPRSRQAEQRERTGRREDGKEKGV